MGHFAKVVDGIVENVIVADDAKWCEDNLGGTWIKTSYNTNGGVHSEGGIALHKNYAGIGHTWDGIGFAAPQPYPSWTLNAETYYWEPPTPYPIDSKTYNWDEPTLSWKQA